MFRLIYLFIYPLSYILILHTQWHTHIDRGAVDHTQRYQ